MKQVQNSLKDLLQRTFIRDGEISITAVMAFVLSALFMHIYIKAEVFGLPFSETILDKITLVFEIVIIGSAGKAAVRQGVARWGGNVVDMVNQKRAERQAERKGQANDDTDPVKPNTEETHAYVDVPVKREPSINALAAWSIPFLGLKEIPGQQHNPTIMDWIASMGWSRKYPGFDSDEDAWCSLPPNVGAKTLGLPYSDSPAAKSWLSVGEPISIDAVKAGQYPPDSGIVAVYHRKYIGNPVHTGAGHVAIFEKAMDADTFQTIEGNLSNQFRRSVRRFDDRMFIGFRLLKRSEA